MELVLSLSAYLIPAVILAAAMIILFRPKKDSFPSFVQGAEEGLRSAVRLFPSITALVVASRMLNASGFTEAVGRLLSPITERVGIPGELLPLILTRPVSGAASTAAYSALIEQSGADSFAVMCASVIMGSADTLIYTVAVYMSAGGIKRSRHTLPVAFFVAVFSVFLSCALSRLFYV